MLKRNYIKSKQGVQKILSDTEYGIPWKGIINRNSKTGYKIPNTVQKIVTNSLEYLGV